MTMKTRLILSAGVLIGGVVSSSLAQGTNCNAPLRSSVAIERPREVALSGSTAFVLSTSELASFDVSDISNPSSLDAVALGSSTEKLIVAGDVAYCLSFDGHLYTVDVSDPGDMAVLDDFVIPTTGILPLINGMALDGDTLYVATSSFVLDDGMFTPSNEIQTLDVSEPSDPSVAGAFSPPASQVDTWVYIEVQGSYAYINGAYDVGSTGSFTGGIGVWDISDAMNIHLVGFLPVHVDSFVVRGDSVYIDSPGFVIADVSDPTDPQILSEINVAGPAAGVSVSGNFATYEDKYYNITDPANPYLLFRATSFSPFVQQSLLDGHVFYAITNAGLEIVDMDDCSLACAADLTGDGRVDYFDISMFLHLFMTQDPAADLNADNAFDFFDVNTFLNLYAIGCP